MNERQRWADDVAEGWISTDEYATRQDVKRLGVAEAARYNYDIAREQVARGDKRWLGITVGALRRAFAARGWRRG